MSQLQETVCCMNLFHVHVHVAIKVVSSYWAYRYSGPLHMSLVTGLARLPGRILWCVHMGNFNMVDRDEFKKHNQKGGT